MPGQKRADRPTTKALQDMFTAGYAQGVADLAEIVNQIVSVQQLEEIVERFERKVRRDVLQKGKAS